MAFYGIFLCMALSSARSFLKLGLFLGLYCQQLLMILATSKGQERGAAIRYPEMQHSLSKQAARAFWHNCTLTETKSSGNRLSLQIGQISHMFCFLYLSPPHLSSAGCSCSCRVSGPGKKSPTAKYQSSTRHSRWCSNLETPAGSSIDKGR